VRLIMDPRIYYADLVRLQLFDLLFCELRSILGQVSSMSDISLTEARYATETT